MCPKYFLPKNYGDAFVACLAVIFVSLLRNLFPFWRCFEVEDENGIEVVLSSYRLPAVVVVVSVYMFTGLGIIAVIYVPTTEEGENEQEQQNFYENR